MNDYQNALRGKLRRRSWVVLVTMLCGPVTGALGQSAIDRLDLDRISARIIHVTASPDFLCTSGDDAWFIDNGNSGIEKISASADTPVLKIFVKDACGAPVSGFGALWVISCSERCLYKLQENTGQLLAKIPTGLSDVSGETSLAAGGGSVWILSDSAGVLSRINPGTNRVEARIKVSPGSVALCVGFGAIWVSDRVHNQVQRVDLKSNLLTGSIAVGKNPRFLAAGEGAVWTLDQGAGTVTRIDPGTRQVTATIDVQAPGGGGDIAAGGGRIWVVSTNPSRPLQCIDPRLNRVTRIYASQGSQGPQARTDGAVRSSVPYIWISNLYLKTVWAIPK